MFNLMNVITVCIENSDSKSKDNMFNNQNPSHEMIDKREVMNSKVKANLFFKFSACLPVYQCKNLGRVSSHYNLKT